MSKLKEVLNGVEDGCNHIFVDNIVVSRISANPKSKTVSMRITVPTSACSLGAIENLLRGQVDMALFNPQLEIR